ncbi:hypothetical protein HY792_00665 [Candidatus Desantisbacteria bacterium]|nr:hypothetical protein [Candidatus Desantisbacteria bacterium]
MVLGVGGNGFVLAAAMAPTVEVSDASGDLIGGYYTIQEGINACSNGGKVSVSAGTYMEAIYIDMQIALVGNTENLYEEVFILWLKQL